MATTPTRSKKLSARRQGVGATIQQEAALSLSSSKDNAALLAKKIMRVGRKRCSNIEEDVVVDEGVVEAVAKDASVVSKKRMWIDIVAASSLTDPTFYGFVFVSAG